MSAIGSIVDNAFGVDAPRANVADPAPTAVDDAAAAAAERSTAVRRAAQRDLASYIVPLNNAPAEGTGLYIPK
jgi:hypothetical protein